MSEMRLMKEIEKLRVIKSILVDDHSRVLSCEAKKAIQDKLKEIQSRLQYKLWRLNNGKE